MSRCRWSASTTAMLANTAPSTSRPVVVTTRATCSTVLTALSSCASWASIVARLTSTSRRSISARSSRADSFATARAARSCRWLVAAVASAWSKVMSSPDHSRATRSTAQNVPTT